MRNLIYFIINVLRPVKLKLYQTASYCLVLEMFSACLGECSIKNAEG
jgi:hypothetical protein